MELVHGRLEHDLLRLLHTNSLRYYPVIKTIAQPVFPVYVLERFFLPVRYQGNGVPLLMELAEHFPPVLNEIRP